MKLKYAIVSLLLLSSFFFACSVPSPADYESDRLLFEKAKQLYEKKNYSQAADHFENLINRFPKSPHVIESELYLGDAKFNQLEYLEAEFAYASFKKLHPSHPKIPYVTLQLGKTHFNRARKAPERDQTHTKHALRYYNEVLRKWPGTEESEEALTLQETAQRRLVEQEIYIADFYRKQRERKAAISRYKEVPHTFEDLYDKAQFYIGKLQLKLGNKEEARKHLNQIKKTPEYLSKSKKLLKRAQ